MLCVQWKTPNDGQRNFPKPVEFYSKNKFEKLVHLVDFYYKNNSVRLKAKFVPVHARKIYGEI